MMRKFYHRQTEFWADSENLMSPRHSSCEAPFFILPNAKIFLSGVAHFVCSGDGKGPTWAFIYLPSDVLSWLVRSTKKARWLRAARLKVAWKIVFTMGTEIKSSFGSANAPVSSQYGNRVHQELLKAKVVTVMYSRCFGDDNENFWHIATLEQFFPGIIIIGWLVWLLLSWKRRPSGAFYWWKYF